MSVDGETSNDNSRLMLGQASNMTMHTGNVIDWFLLKKNRRYSMISPDELIDGMSCVMRAWMKEVNSDDDLDIDETPSNLEVSNLKLVKQIDPDLRNELKISVKLFLSNTKPGVIRDAINKITHNLNVQQLDSVLVSFPISSDDANKKVDTDFNQSSNGNNNMPDLDTVKEIWQELESCVKSGQIHQIGVCDFDQNDLQVLYDWAETKPSVNQINLNSCCQVPNDLLQYSTQNGIELLTHNDPPEILPVRTFQTFLSERTENVATAEWSPAFVARYAVLVKFRGIVHSKGYVVSADRANPNAQIEDFAFF